MRFLLPVIAFLFVACESKPEPAPECRALLVEMETLCLKSPAVAFCQEGDGHRQQIKDTAKGTGPGGVAKCKVETERINAVVDLHNQVKRQRH